MNFKLLAFIVMGSLVASCAAPVQDQGTSDDVAVAPAAEALTLTECVEQRDACFRRYPLFGLFTCPAQYTQCVATAENGIPAQVTAAIADAAECVDEAIACRGAAESAAELLTCTAEEAECVAAIVDAQIPDVVTGTAECVTGAVDCIRASESAGDLDGCADTLEDCAVDQVVSVLPPEVGTVVEDVNQCTLDLGECTEEAQTPSALTACSEDYVACVGDGLGVDLPNVPASDALACAEHAAACTFEARSLGELGECGDEYLDCTIALVDGQLTCEQQFTACLTENPFAFLQCSAELLTCGD